MGTVNERPALLILGDKQTVTTLLSLRLIVGAREIHEWRIRGWSVNGVSCRELPNSLAKVKTPPTRVSRTRYETVMGAAVGALNLKPRS